MSRKQYLLAASNVCALFVSLTCYGRNHSISTVLMVWKTSGWVYQGVPWEKKVLETLYAQSSFGEKESYSTYELKKTPKTKKQHQKN